MKHLDALNAGSQVAGPAAKGCQCVELAVWSRDSGHVHRDTVVSAVVVKVVAASFDSYTRHCHGDVLFFSVYASTKFDSA